jgi:hypothetical protein
VAAKRHKRRKKQIAPFLRLLRFFAAKFPVFYLTRMGLGWVVFVSFRDFCGQGIAGSESAKKKRRALKKDAAMGG